MDVIVTDQGVAVNPLRKELGDRLKDAGIHVVDIGELRDKALKLVGTPAPIQYTDKVVGIVTYRDGSVIDLVRQVKDNE